ncbi:MAG TPA: peroxiredoxin [Tichowtungia sp.]|nr:peroxiredoxin [Tichowtungia sp.]
MMKKRSWFLIVALIGLTAVAAELTVGDAAPAFSAVDQDGNIWALEEHLGGEHLVVYFYPAAMTGGCTKQACSYRDYIERSDEPDFTVVGISGDSPENLRVFKQAETLNFTLLSDADGAIANAFGVPVSTGERSITRTVDGKEVELKREATIKRWTFVIDPQGKIVYRDNQVKATEDLANILKFLGQ